MKKWAKRILAGLGITVATLFLLECAVRGFFPQNNWAYIYKIDPRLGPVHVPGAKYRQSGAHGEFDALVEINSEGFRGREIGTKPLILALGDSVTQGTGVSNPDMWTELLTDMLGQFQVLNGAMASYAPAEYLQTYRILREKYQFKMVLVGYFEYNDLQRSSPLWVKLTDTYTGRTCYQPRGKYQDEGQRAWFRGFTKTEGWYNVSRHSHLLRLTKDVVYNTLYPTQPIVADREAIEFTKAMLQGIATAATADHIPTIFLIFPTPPTVPMTPEHKAATDEIVAYLKQNKNNIIDFRGILIPRERFYHHIDDAHFNEMGNLAVAQVLNQVLRGSRATIGTNGVMQIEVKGGAR